MTPHGALGTCWLSCCLHCRCGPLNHTASRDLAFYWSRVAGYITLPCLTRGDHQDLIQTLTYSRTKQRWWVFSAAETRHCGSRWRPTLATGASDHLRSKHGIGRGFIGKEEDFKNHWLTSQLGGTTGESTVGSSTTPLVKAM